MPNYRLKQNIIPFPEETTVHDIERHSRRKRAAFSCDSKRQSAGSPATSILFYNKKVFYLMSFSFSLFAR